MLISTRKSKFWKKNSKSILQFAPYLTTTRLSVAETHTPAGWNPNVF